MACYHQNVVFSKKNAIIKKDGTLGTKVKIVYRHSPEFKGYEYYYKLKEKIEQMDPKDREYEINFVPCGKCVGCRKKEKFEWATRIELESKLYANNYFITLTYDDDHLYIPDQTVNEKTGEIYYNDGTWKGTLIKEDPIRFIKSLRKYFEREFYWKGMKFYLCGEYGDIGDRPHYHAILMNCPELYLNPYGYNKETKDPYYTQERIEKIWNKGFINIGKVSWDSISYVAGYCEKKLFAELKEEYHKSKGQLPIFSNMSRRPGIGNQYFINNKDKIYKNDEIINSKGKSIKPPSYFDRLMDIGESDVLEEIKKQRQEYALNEFNKKMSKTDKSILEQMQTEEEIEIEKRKHYSRGRIRESIY